MYACRYFLQRYYGIFTSDLQSWSSFTVFLPWFTWSKKDRSRNKLKDQLVQCSHLPDKETEQQTTVNLVTYNKHHLSNPCICGLAAFVLWLLSSAGFTHGSMVSCQGGWERANLRSFTWRLISDPHGLPSRSGWVCGWAPREQEEVWMASWSPHLKPVQLGFPHSVGPDKWQNQLRFQEWRIRLHLILAGRRCKELWLLSLFLIYLPNSFMTRSAIFTLKQFRHQSSH